MGTLLQKLSSALVRFGAYFLVIFLILSAGSAIAPQVLRQKSEAEWLQSERQAAYARRQQDEALLAQIQDKCEAIQIERDAVERRRPNRSSLGFLTSSGRQLIALDSALEKCREAVNTAKDRIGALSQGIASIDSNLEQNFWAAFMAPSLGPTLVIVLSGYLLPHALKAFLYFVVAAGLSSASPIRILPGARGNERSLQINGAPGRISSSSQEIILGPGEELLVKAECLQSTPKAGRKSTRALLNPRIPLSSVSSGMYMLTRIEGSGAEPVTVSSMKDPLAEIGVIDVPEGAAFVCQPRALVGIVQDPDKPMSLSKHWHMSSRHAWTALRFRSIAFHGPGKLVVKGFRGLRLETAEAARMIRTSAVLGFSANLGFGGTRSETFAAYLLGKDELANTEFSGGPGVYLFEEIPAEEAGRRTGRLGGIFDAGLKALGI